MQLRIAGPGIEIEKDGVVLQLTLEEVDHLAVFIAECSTMRETALSNLAKRAEARGRAAAREHVEKAKRGLEDVLAMLEMKP